MNGQSKARALEDLKQILERIPDLMGASTSSPDFKKWRRDAAVAIRHVFGDESDHVEEFRKVRFTPIAASSRTDWSRPYRRGMESARAILESMISEIERYWRDEDSTAAASKSFDGLGGNNRKIFIIHGHDGAARQAVARFLERLGLYPVILDEKPSKGRTIIEKFDEYADVRYAIALLTADDIGSRRGEDGVRPRARQNVIFELGYFIGRLGREQVCALTKGEPEIPSDYSGVVYISMDAGDWKTGIFKELRAAGFDIDANKVFT